MFSTQSVQPFVSEVAQLKEKLSRLKDNQLIFIT